LVACLSLGVKSHLCHFPAVLHKVRAAFIGGGKWAYYRIRNVKKKL
jgi:hypothetical protein